MTKDEISKIKEHIEIHARRERRAIVITEILWKAVDELEHIEELKIDNYNLNANLQRLSDMLDESKKIIKDLLMSEYQYCKGETFLEIRDRAEIFINNEVVKNENN